MSTETPLARKNTTQASLDKMLPTGAYASLSTLQSLRYLAKKYTPTIRGKSKALLSGHHKSHAVNRGMEFEDVRPYQAGDDIRSIDWRVTARTQTTYSKRYSEEKERPIITAVDQRRSLFFGSKACFKSVYACHLAAIINWLTLQSGDRSGGLVLGKNIQETRAARHHKTVNRWLQQLSQANNELSTQQQQEPSLSDFIDRVIHTTQTGTQIYIISDFYDVDNETERRLFQLARHHSVSLLWVVDPLETYLPDTARIIISNGQSTTPLLLEQKTKQLFADGFLKKQQILTDISQRLGIRLIKASTQAEPMTIVKEAFN